MNESAYNDLAKVVMAFGILLFFTQSALMMALTVKRLKLRIWLRLAMIWRTLALLCTIGGLLLAVQGPKEAELLAERLLLVGIVNLIIATIQGIRVHSAIRKALRRQEQEEGEAAA